MEQRWLGQGIPSYRIEVLVVNSIWHAQTHQIVVRNNQVESARASCVPAPMENGECKLQDFNADDYTIEGLFAKARKELQDPNSQWVKVTYDPTYGYPSQITFDQPEVMDDDWAWRVTAFEVLK